MNKNIKVADLHCYLQIDLDRISIDNKIADTGFYPRMFRRHNNTTTLDDCEIVNVAIILQNKNIFQTNATP